LFVAAFVAPYIGYAVRGTMPFLNDARGMGATVLVLAAAAVLLFGRHAFGDGTFLRVVSGVSAVVVGFAVAAIAVETTDALLIPAVAAAIVLWALLIAHDAGWLPARAHSSSG
jgi:hypothetical protein